MLHTIKMGTSLGQGCANRAIEIEPSENKKMVVLAVCERDANGYKQRLEALEFMSLETCQALIFALTETCERIRAAA